MRRTKARPDSWRKSTGKSECHTTAFRSATYYASRTTRRFRHYSSTARQPPRNSIAEVRSDWRPVWPARKDCRLKSLGEEDRQRIRPTDRRWVWAAWIEIWKDNRVAVLAAPTVNRVAVVAAPTVNRVPPSPKSPPGR